MLIRRAALLIPVIAVGLLLLPAIPPADAAPAQSAEGFINALADEAIKTLSGNAPTDERTQRFKEILAQDFDMPRISRFVLGRYWLSASDQEKQEFQKLFQEYVVRAYANRFSSYSGQTVKVTGSRAEGQDDTVVSTQILQPSGAPPIKVDWTVRKSGDDFRITDVSVEGVSMALTQKQEFAAVIERNGGGIAGLNKAIQDKLGATATAQQ
ncbi:MAG TPA: ABC transporter substrate-binding protein [Stellaceae bacterium]|nr:ABC transporter substrate-binding protein [Stellaceae bacterium]